MPVAEDVNQSKSMEESKEIIKTLATLAPVYRAGDVNVGNKLNISLSLPQ